MTEPRFCSECHAPPKNDVAGGLCPACLLKLGIIDPDRPTVVISQEARASRIGDRLQCFGDYELLEEIAHGAMGVVYRARQVSLNRLVAVKMIRSGELATESEVKRFRAEAEAAASLNHPNIVTIYEVGEHEGQHYFSMRLVEGASLAGAAAFRHDAALPAGRNSTALYRDAVTLLAKVARAIHSAHQCGILHRDIKPGNILIDPQGEPHVTDFGLAKRVNGDRHLTLRGEALGTPAYMSPEQVSGRHGKVGPYSDVYSLGATLYYLLTGRPPFQGEIADILEQVLKTDPVLVRRLNPSVPKDLETICLKCLQKEAVRRYATAEELAEDLERWLQHKPIRARRAGPFLRSDRWVRRNPWATGLILSLAIGLATTVWLLLIIQQGEHDSETAYQKMKEFSGAIHNGVTWQLTNLWASSQDSMPIKSLELDALFLPDLRRQEFKQYFPRKSRIGQQSWKVSVGVFAHENPVEEAEGYAPLLKCLERDMPEFLQGETVEIDLIFYKSEEQGREDLIAGRVDFMRVGAINYLLVHEVNPNIQPLVEGINPGKTACFFAKTNSGIRTWKDMKGKRLGVGEANSTIDVLALNFMATNGITGINLHYTFAGSHDEFEEGNMVTNAPGHAAVIQGVLTNRFDIGVTRDKYVRATPRLAPIKGTEFPSTRNLWVAGTTNSAVANAFRQAMLALRRYPWLEDLRDKPGGYRAVTDATYGGERQALQRVRKLFPVKNKVLQP